MTYICAAIFHETFVRRGWDVCRRRSRAEIWWWWPSYTRKPFRNKTSSKLRDSRYSSSPRKNPGKTSEIAILSLPPFYIEGELSCKTLGFLYFLFSVKNTYERDEGEVKAESAVYGVHNLIGRVRFRIDSFFQDARNSFFEHIFCHVKFVTSSRFKKNLYWKLTSKIFLKWV